MSQPIPREKVETLLAKYKARREDLSNRMQFCHDHNMHEEERFLRVQRDIFGEIFIDISNDLLGIFY